MHDWKNDIGINTDNGSSIGLLSDNFGLIHSFLPQINNLLIYKLDI